MKRSRILLIAAAAVLTVVALSPLASILAQQADEAGLWPSTRAHDPDLEGVWRSRGYGWIWDVKDGRVKAYEESGSLCLKSSRRRFDIDDPETALEIGPDKKSFTVLSDDNQYRYAFDRIDALPASCGVKPATDPLSVFDATVETLNAHYAFFDTREVAWEKAVATERANITARMRGVGLFQTISRLLSNFRDSHVSLEGEIGDDEIEYSPSEDPKIIAMPRPAVDQPPQIVQAEDTKDYWNPAAGEELLDKVETAFDEDIVYGRIDEDIGYLAIRSMSDDSLPDMDRVLRSALELFKGTTALIIDVSANDGGYDSTAREIAGHFAASRALAYFKYPGDFGEVQRQAIYVEPRGNAPYSGPIFLLAGRNTVSAAEIFVLAMRALPNVTQIGEPTDGSLSDILEKPLPNGWTLSLSNEVYQDLNGFVWEGIGIPPEVKVRIKSGSGDASEEDIAAAERVVEFIRSLVQHKETAVPADAEDHS